MLQTINDILPVLTVMIALLVWYVRLEFKTSLAESLVDRANIKSSIVFLEKDLNAHKESVKDTHNAMGEKLDQLSNKLENISTSTAKIEGYLFSEKKQGG